MITKAWATARSLPPRDLLLAGAALLLSAAIWLHATGSGAGAGYDFGAYLAGAHAVAAGHNPYAGLVVHGTVSAAGVSAHGYVYPPLLADLLALPVRLGLSDTAIWVLWNLLNIAAVLWMGAELARGLPHPPAPSIHRWGGAALLTAALLLPAVITYDLTLGQADVLLTALAVGACGLWLRGQGWAAAAVLALAIAVKPPFAVLLLVWLWGGDWRAAVRGAGLAVALLALAFVPVGLAALHDYAIFFTQWNAFHADAEYINQSPGGMLLRLFTRNPYTTPLVQAPWLVTPLRLAALAGAVALWLRAVPRPRPGIAPWGWGELLLAFPLIVLLSPLAEDIHFTVLAPALVGLGWLAWARGLWRRPSAWVLWGTYAIACIPRMQEMIYPTRFVPLPGQSLPILGHLLILARTGTLLALAVATLAAGGQIVRSVRTDAHISAPITPKAGA